MKYGGFTFLTESLLLHDVRKHHVLIRVIFLHEERRFHVLIRVIIIA